MTFLDDLAASSMLPAQIDYPDTQMQPLGILQNPARALSAWRAAQRSVLEATPIGGLPYLALLAAVQPSVPVEPRAIEAVWYLIEATALTLLEGPERKVVRGPQYASVLSSLP